MKNIYKCMIVSLSLLSCTTKKKLTFEFPNMPANSIELQKTGEFAIELDSTIGITNESIVFYEENDSSKLSIFNAFDASIHIYDYLSGKLLKKVQFDINGENGIGKFSNMGHFMDSSDSIFLTNHWENRVYLLNNKAEILKKYTLENPDLHYGFYLMTNAASPMQKLGNKLYITLQNSSPDQSQTRSVVELDLRDSSQNYFIKGSSFLDSAFWGPLTPYTFSGTFNLEDSVFISSVAKDPEIRAYKLNSLESPHIREITSSNYVSNFTSFPKKGKNPPLYGYGYKEIASETNKKALFTAVIYDKYNGLYFRQIILPRTQENYELRVKGITFSMIILDKNLKKIGETKLPKGKYVPNFFFVGSKGLHLANLEKYNENENKLTFDIYAPKTIKTN